MSQTWNQPLDRGPGPSVDLQNQAMQEVHLQVLQGGHLANDGLNPFANAVNNGADTFTRIGPGSSVLQPEESGALGGTGPTVIGGRHLAVENEFGFEGGGALMAQNQGHSKRMPHTPPNSKPIS